MENKHFYPEIAAVILAAGSAGYILATNQIFSAPAAAILVLGSILLLRHITKKGRLEGLTDQQKIALTSSTVLYELLIFTGAFSLNIVPKYAAVITFAAIGFSEVLKLELNQKLKTAQTHDIGREGRLLVLAGSLIAYEFNSFFLFYGVLLVFVLSVYDSLRLIHRLR